MTILSILLPFSFEIRAFGEQFGGFDAKLPLIASPHGDFTNY